MKIINQFAEEFSDSFYQGPKINNLENLKSKLDKKLDQFHRDKDKLQFLHILLSETNAMLRKHEKTCRGNGCHYNEDREIGKFVIEQEIDQIEQYYTNESGDEDKFTFEEKSKLYEFIDKISEQLDRQDAGQEVLFEEIQDLKNHFNLGKKNWHSLFIGKVIGAFQNKLIEKTIVNTIFDEVSDIMHETERLIA